MDIRPNERIDDLEINGYKIIQDQSGFCFGIDSVLISDFAKKIKKNSKVIDLGTGSGIIPTLLCAKTLLREVVGVEIQSDVAEMAKRSIKLNNLEDRFRIINCNVTDVSQFFGNNCFDVVVTNPPYKKLDTGKINLNEKKLISRHEIKANLEDFIKVSSKILKDRGEFYMVHRPDRLADIIEYLRKYKLEPKELRFVHPNENKEPNILLLKAIKNARPFLKILKPLYVYNMEGEYTDEILKIYNKEVK